MLTVADASGMLKRGKEQRSYSGEPCPEDGHRVTTEAILRDPGWLAAWFSDECCGRPWPRLYYRAVCVQCGEAGPWQRSSLLQCRFCGRKLYDGNAYD